MKESTSFTVGLTIFTRAYNDQKVQRLFIRSKIGTSWLVKIVVPCNVNEKSILLGFWARLFGISSGRIKSHSVVSSSKSQTTTEI